MLLLLMSILITLFTYLVMDYIVTARKDKIRERLSAGTYVPDEANVSMWSDASDLMRVAEIRNLLYTSPLARKFDLMIKRASLNITLPQAILIFVSSAFVPAIISYLLWDSIIAFLISMLVIPVILWLILSTLSSRQQKKQDAQLPGLISSLITTIRSGGTPSQALQSIVRNSSPPISTSMSEVLNSIQLGLSPNQAWKDWAEFWETRNCRLLATGIRLKWEAGGQMSAILQHIQETLEFNRKMELRISTLTALARLSAWILSALPLALALVTYIYRRDLFMVMLTDPMGIKLLIGAGVLNLLGLIVMQRMAKLK